MMQTLKMFETKTKRGLLCMDDTEKELKEKASLSKADVEIAEDISSLRSKLTRATVGRGTHGRAEVPTGSKPNLG
jgi:hypothetical protein